MVSRGVSKTKGPPQGNDEQSKFESKTCEQRDLLEKKGMEKPGIKKVLINLLIGKVAKGVRMGRLHLWNLIPAAFEREMQKVGGR